MNLFDEVGQNHDPPVMKHDLLENLEPSMIFPLKPREFAVALFDC